jgi:hypothetical protein
MDDQEQENVRLKQRVVELEVAPTPRPLFVEPLSTLHSVEESPVQVCKFDKVTWLLTSIRSFVVEGIKTTTNLILEAFEILKNTQNMGI